MKYIELLEYINIDKTNANYGVELQKKLEKDNSAKSKDTKEVISFITNEVDPTPQGKYTIWILRSYIKNGIRKFEDMSRVAHYLELFHKFKNRLPIKDINQIKTLSDLGEMVLPFEEQQTEKEKKKNLEKEFLKNNEVKIIYNSENLKVVIPKSERASCYYGRSTQWCTAATKGQNYFRHYTEDGPLYIVIDKPNNKRYQLHFATKEYMDENDRRIKLYKFFESYPELLKIPPFNNYFRKDGKYFVTSRYYKGRKASEVWTLNGIKHRDNDEPAFIEYNDNGKVNFEGWFQNGKLHRTGGPAVIEYNDKGTVILKKWFQNGKNLKEHKQLTEYKIMKMDRGHTDVVIVKNPSTNQILNLLKRSKAVYLRGLIHGEDIYVWDSWLAEHFDVKYYLDSLGIPFDIDWSKDDDHWHLYEVDGSIFLDTYDLKNKRLKKLADLPIVRVFVNKS